MKKNWHQIWWKFREFILHVSPPYEFHRALFTKLKPKKDIDETQARELYELLCVLVMDDDPSFSSVTIEELLEVSERRKEFNEIFERASKCNIDEWRKKDAIRKKNQIEERETRQARNIENLSPHRFAIEAGDATKILDHYARVWFGLFTNVDSNLPPKERLCQEVGDDLEKSIETGFIKALDKPIFNTLKDIAETDIQSRAYHRGYLMLAAMNILADKGKKHVLNLPEDILSLAIAYKMANPVTWNFSWPKWLIEEKPDFYWFLVNLSG